MDTRNIYDITLVGGGPTSLFAAFYAGMRKAKTKIIESLPQLGGQLAMLYPEKKIYDIPGFPEIKALDLIQNLIKQNNKFDHTICLEEEVLYLEQEKDAIIRLETLQGVHYSRAVIITAGNGSFQPRRLELAGAKNCEGISVHYHIMDPALFKNQNVIICGGGDSAIDWALMLESVAKSVQLVHRRPQFRGHEHSVELLRQSKVEILTPFIIDSISHDQGKLTNVGLRNVQTETKKDLTADHLIVNYGFTSSIGTMNEWGLDIQKKAIMVNSDMSTNIPGVFAAGDICTYEGKVKLLASGFGEAPTAVNNAMRYIDPEARLQPMHSTSVFNQKS